MSEEIKIERDEEAKVVTPVVETESRLTAPMIEHEGRVVRLEEQHIAQREEMQRKIEELEARLVTATGTRATELEARIATLEGRIQEEVSSEVPDTSVELSLPEVEASPEPPEKVRQGMNHRRKAKRNRSA
jgi:hypothetical protein